MFRAISRWWPRGTPTSQDPAQLGLGIGNAQPSTAEELLRELRALGLKRVERCRLTHNRTVMVSLRSGELRVHEGYLAAPVDVWRAIVNFVEGRTRRERNLARRVLLGFPVQRSASTPARPPRGDTHPDDRAWVAQLRDSYARLNEQYFAGSLGQVDLGVSRRMQTRLGHYSKAVGGARAQIVISARHVRAQAWEEVMETLLHEMVHQWQDETHRTIDHGATFRKKAREVGIEPRARRTTTRRLSR